MNGRRVRTVSVGAVLHLATLVAACTQPVTVDDPPTVPTTTAVSPTAPTSATTSAPERATSSTISPEPRPSIVLGFAGDTSFTHGNDGRDPLGAVADLLRAPDLMVLNLETAVADPEVGRPPVDKTFLFKSPPAALDQLVAAGVDVVTLANNHTLDYGPDALAQTLTELDARGIGRLGAGLDQAEAYRPLVLDVGGWKVGLVSLSRVPCDWSASGENLRPQVAWACPALLADAEVAVRRAVDDAEVVVVLVHGGIEGELCPAPFMEDLNRRWAELGADLVVNGHPHVLQGFTSIERTGEPPTMVLRSTGNFAFPSSRGITGNSGVLQVTVGPSARGLAGGRPELSLQFIPVRSDGGVLRIPGETERQGIIEQVNQVSNGWRLDEAGILVEDPDVVGC